MIFRHCEVRERREAVEAMKEQMIEEEKRLG